MVRRWAAAAIAVVLPIITLLSSGCVRPAPTTASAAANAARSPLSPRPSAAVIRDAYGRLPLQFEENRGQADPSVKYLSRGQGYGLYLTSSDVVLRLGDESMRITLVEGEASGAPTGIEELPGKANYLLGQDESRWRTGVATYAKVRYPEVYPGIDAVFYGNQRQLEYDFVVAPGADPARIRLAFSGASSVTVDDHGDLHVAMKNGTVLQRKPIVYQDIDGARVEVDGGYVMRGRREVGFRIGAYDRRRPLIIDPVVSYATYLGGSGDDVPLDVAVDGSGNAYVVGQTLSPDFPVTGGLQPMQRTMSGDAFVAKLNPTGTALVYSTYLGGSVSDSAVSVAVDVAGNAVIAGRTGSTDFPTVNATQSTPARVFVAKLNASGSALVYSTYLGNGDGFVSGVAVDASGNAFVAGVTDSTTFPTTPGAYQVTTEAGDNQQSSFITKLTATGALGWSTYFSSGGNVFIHGIAVDSSGVYVTGFTVAPDFPTTPGAFQTTDPNVVSSGAQFVTKLDPTGSSLIYSTLLGGNGAENATAIAVWNGFAHITGVTNSTDFPIVNAAQTAHASSSGNPGDAFVSKLNQNGTGLVFSTYLGGRAGDIGHDIGVDGSGNVYVTGFTTSGDFPSKDAIRPFTDTDLANGNYFVTKFDAAGALVYSTPVASGNTSNPTAMAVDASGNAYVTGRGAVSTTPGAFQATPPGAVDGFVVKLAPANAGGGTGDTTPPTVTITSPANGVWTGAGINVTATASDNVGLASIKLWGNGGMFGTINCNNSPTCTGTMRWETGALPAAAYEVNAVATDTAGNQTISTKVTINKDARSPVVPSGATATGSTGLPPLIATIASPANGATVSGSTVISFSASGAQGKPLFMLVIDSNQVLYSGNAPGGGSSTSTTWSANLVTNGTHTLNLTVQDEAGRTAKTSVTVNVVGGSTSDVQKPAATITTPSNGAWTGAGITVGVHAIDNVAVATIKLWANGGVFATITCGGPTCDGAVTWATGALAPGAYEITALAIDTAGNQAVSPSVTIYKDATSPHHPSGASTTSAGLGAAFAKPTSGATLSGATTIQLNATGVTPGSTLTYSLKIDGVAPAAQAPVTGVCNQSTCVTTWTWDTTPATNASHTLVGTVSDTAGHTASATVTVTVANTTGGGGGGGDTTAPSVAITKPSNGAWTGNSISITAAGSDNAGLTSIAIYGNGALVQTVSCGGAATCNTGLVWWSTGSLPSGKHTITAVATDTSGNKTTSAPVVINK